MDYLSKLPSGEKMHNDTIQLSNEKKQDYYKRMVEGAKIQLPCVKVDWETETVTEVNYWIPVTRDNAHIGCLVRHPDGILMQGGMSLEAFKRIAERFLKEGIPMFQGGPPHPYPPYCYDCGQDMEYHYYEEDEDGPAFAEFECGCCGKNKKAPLPPIIDYEKFKSV